MNNLIKVSSMRIILLFILLISGYFRLLAQEPKFFVDKPIHKFPKTKEGVVLEHIFHVQNKGTKPLIISDYKVACSCTKAFLPNQPIVPGGEADIKILFDTKGKSYFQDRIIYLTTNTKRGEEKLRIKVSIE